MYMTNRIHRLYGDNLIPPVTLRHLKTLTDCTGILQHAKYGIPNRFEGYCTDDNVRALLVTAKHYNVFRDESIFELLRTYMAFTFHAQKEDGLVHNFVSYQRDFLDSEGSDDMLGRTLWACGYICSSTKLPKGVREVARTIFERAAKHATSDLTLRGIAYSLLGFYHSRASIPEIRERSKCFQLKCCTATKIRGPPIGNGLKLSCLTQTLDCPKLLLAYDVIGEPKLLSCGERTLGFL